jgi:hypothetical protein
MNNARIRIRANRTTGELEVEGPSQAVSEWWEKTLARAGRKLVVTALSRHPQPLPPTLSNGQLPELFA